MNSDLTRSIVRILDAESKTCGTGFVVHAGDDSRIVTCAHVVELAKSGPGHSIALTFSPFDLDRSAEKSSAIVEQAFWRDADAEDLAVLHLEEPLPSGVDPLRLGSSLGSEDHVFQSYGFGAVKPKDGLWGKCTVRGLTSENGFPVLQMDSGEVSHGFSGAPVWDKELQVVVGMVTSISRPDSAGRQTRANFVIPAETLSRVCPDLRLTDKCPYRGLSTFTEEDWAVFSGREQAIKELLKKLRANPQFLVVFGPSGSGKSSLVRAGLIPRLHEKNRLPGKDWGVIVTRPADNPFKQLTDQGLDLEPGGLLGGVRGWLTQHPDKQRLLLVIDQFEELFVTCPEAQRSLFLKQLTQLRNEPFVTVIIVMRNDFYSQFIEHEALREWLAMSGGVTDIPQTLTRNDVLEMILQPAERYRLRFQEALPDLIMRDVMQESSHPGDEDEETAQCTVLPLLEFVLTQLWEERQQGVLTSEAYRAIGGVAGGLTQWANHVLARLGEKRRPLVERVFLALVHLGNETSRQPDSRQPVSLASLTALGRNDSEHAALQYVVQELVNARLLVIDGDLHQHENTVEIIHETLLQHWSALQSWIASNRSFLQWRQELEQRAQAWIETNPEDVSQRDEGRLLRGRDLAAAEDMFNTRLDELTDSQREYILVSQKQMSDELEKERQRAAELSTALETAQRQKQIALARALAAQSELLLYQYPRLMERSVLLAIEAIQRFASSETDRALRRSIELLRNRHACLVHNEGVTAVAFSPDGQYIATASQDHTAAMWETASGRRIKTFLHEDSVTTVVFSPDGRYITTTSLDQTVAMWETATGLRLTSLSNTDDVKIVAFSPDGKYLVTTSSKPPPTDIKIWNTVTGHYFPSHEYFEGKPIVAFSPDGRYLALASNGRYNVAVFDVAIGLSSPVEYLTCEEKIQAVAFSLHGKYLVAVGWSSAEIWRIPNREPWASGRLNAVICASVRLNAAIHAVAFSPDEEYLATGSSDQAAIVWKTSTGSRVISMSDTWHVRALMFSSDGNYLTTTSGYAAGIWEVATGCRLALLPHLDVVKAVAFSPDGRYLATASLDGTAGIWETVADHLAATLPHEPRAESVAFSPDGRYLATNAGCWEILTGHCLRSFSNENYIVDVAFSPDGKYLAAATEQTATAWEIATGHPITFYPLDELSGSLEKVFLEAIVFSPDGKYLAASGQPTAVWEVTTGRLLPLAYQWRGSESVAFSPDGRYLAVAGGAYDTGLWEIAIGRQLERLAHASWEEEIAFSPDGRYIAAISGTTAGIWMTATGELVAYLSHEEKVQAVAFSPDSKLLATASWNNFATIWETTTGNKLLSLAHEDHVKAVVFSPDGRYLATASLDNTAAIWEAATGRQLVSLTCQVPGVIRPRFLAFSPDGRYLAAASSDIAKVWLWHPEDLIADAQNRLTRNLTLEEWRKYFSDEPYRKTVPHLQ